MKKISIIATMAILVFASCANESELFNDNNIDKNDNIVEKKGIPILLDGKVVSYFTISNRDSINSGGVGLSDSLGINPAPTIMRSSTSNDDSDLSQFVDFPVYIILRESNSSAKYLTHQGVNQEIVLKNYDANNSVYQTFFIEGGFLSNPFSLEVLIPKITVLLQIVLERKYVIAAMNSSSNINMLHVRDSDFGSKTWNILPSQRILSDGGAYIFYNAATHDGTDIFSSLCMQSENTNIRFGRYMEKGTQEWEIRPRDDFDMVSLQIIADNSSTVVKKPDFYVTWTYNNNTDVDQNMSTNFSHKATRTSNFTRRNSVSLSIGTTLKVGAPVFLNGQISTTVASTNEWTYGQTEQVEDTRAYNFPILIPKRTKVVTTLYIAQYEMNLKYQAVFRGKLTGKYYTEIGDWKGVDCTDINVDVQFTDAVGNTENLVFKGVPTSQVAPPSYVAPSKPIKKVPIIDTLIP